MKVYHLPALPDGFRYGAETMADMPEAGVFSAPEGCVIKAINIDDKKAIVVPIQKEINGTWCTAKL